MHVITGGAKGRKLLAPKGLNTRPITAKIKGALFNVLQMQIEQSHFLDLFAGSWSVGIEAISRGAEYVAFVEKDWRAVDTIKRNISVCNLKNCYDIYRDDVFRRIKKFKENNEEFDIIYLDPPFKVDPIFLKVMTALSDGKIVSKNGIVVIRSKRDKEMPQEIGVLGRYKQKNYSLSALHFYRVIYTS